MEEYKNLSEDREVQYQKKNQNTCLMIATYTLAILNLISTLGAVCLCVVYGGTISIVHAFYGNSNHVGILELAIFFSVLLLALSVGWMVLTGYLIASLVKKTLIRCSKVCCGKNMHTVAILIIVLRTVLTSIICGLEAIILEFSPILFLFFIDLALNAVFLVVCYYYAVKLNFGNPEKHRIVLSRLDE